MISPDRDKNLFLFASDGLPTRLFTVAIKIILLCSLSIGLTHAEENLENKIKVAYLYNFTKFITWQPISGSNFNICVVGHNPFKDLLLSLEDKTAQDKPIRIQQYDTVKQAVNCQIVYFEKADLSSVFKQQNTLVVGTLNNSLTVGSQPFFAEAGGMIGFSLEDGKVKLHINLKVLKQSGLNISAKLLEVATIVGED